MLPDLSILKNYGLAIFLVIFIAGVFIYLLKTIVSQWTQQTKDFTNVIQNHLMHSTQALNDTCKILTGMQKEIENGFEDTKEAHRKEREEHDDILREIKSK